MSVEDLNVKNIYVIGENLRDKIGEEEGNVFSGQRLVTWLQLNDGQVDTREDAVRLGRYLVEYRVIQHVDEKYHFVDDPNKTYRFCCDNNDVHPRTDSQRQVWVQGLSIFRQFTVDQPGGKRRKTSLISLINRGSLNTSTFKGKNLLVWLEKNTDFESREDCRRFLKSLLKLNFIRSSQNDLRFIESGEYWFYLARLKEDGSKMRRLSRTLAQERKVSVEKSVPSLTRKQSVIGLTPDLIEQLASTQPSGPSDKRSVIKLKDTCGVLRSSLSRTSLTASQSSLTQRSTSGQSSTAVQLDSRNSSLCDRAPEIAQNNCGFDKENKQFQAQTYVNRLKEQYTVVQRKRSSQSECDTSASVTNLIESADFQKRLQNIGRSSSQKNLKQVEEDRRAILYELTERKYGIRSGVMSPASSCPKNLDSLLKRDYSTESRVTTSSGYGSIKGKSYSDVSSSSSSSSCPDHVSSPSLCSNSDLHVSSSRDSWSSTPTSQCESPRPGGTCDDDKVPRDTADTVPRDNHPVPPPRRSLEREEQHHPVQQVLTSPDYEMITRLMSSGALKMQTATSARRARLIRARAVSHEGNL